MKQHYVEFFSPGTFFSETRMEKVEKHDIKDAVGLARNVKERWGATPYGFRFVTRSRKHDELDARVTFTSPIYYLGGNVLTVEDIKARNDPKDDILISNMKINGYKRVIENCNSYKVTMPLNDDDVILDFTP